MANATGGQTCAALGFGATILFTRSTALTLNPTLNLSRLFSPGREEKHVAGFLSAFVLIAKVVSF